MQTQMNNITEYVIGSQYLICNKRKSKPKINVLVCIKLGCKKLIQVNPDSHKCRLNDKRN